MVDEYNTITNKKGQGTYSEKRSKFLAFSHHVENTDDVKTILHEYRTKYFDARHVCYAYMLGAERNEYRTNDDGEPSGTAGKPILGQINKNKLTNILIVVVRYYGGVNLGTGGLIVAYRSAAELAISDSDIVSRKVEVLIKYDFPYIRMNDIMRIVKGMQARVISQEYSDNCSITLSIRKSMAEELRGRLSKLDW